MTKLEEVARALAVYQFGSPKSWEDQIPMARVAVEALQEPNSHQYDSLSATGMLWRDMNSEFVWRTYIDAILSEKPE